MNFKKFLRVSIIFLVIFSWIFGGWPQIWKNPAFPPEIKKAKAATATYDFSICAPSATCDTSLDWWASGDDVDVFPFAGATANRNTHTEATDAQYSALATSNNTRYATLDPGAGDKIFLWNEMKINESTSTITQIDLTFEGYLALTANFSIWVKKTGQAYELDASWVQVGTVQSITGAVETSFTRSITANFGDYIGADGMLTWGVYEDVSSELMNIDYVSAVVTYTPPTITVGTTGTQTANMNTSSTNNYVGGAFTFVRNTGSADVTQIIITDTGTVNANLNLSNVVLFYKTEATCSTSIPADATQYNSTGVGFNASEKATVTGTMAVGTSQICAYVRLDVGSGATNNQTLEIEISNPSTEVSVSAGSVTPATPVAIAGTTSLQYAPATWMAPEDQNVTGINKQTNIRLRIEVANTGGSANNYQYRLEYASKVGAACGDDESFLAVPVNLTAANEHFEMTTSTSVSNGSSTTAKLTNSEGYVFVSGYIVADPANTSPVINLGINQYTEIEYVFQASTYATGGNSYCFRVTNAGTVLNGYPIYPELTLATGLEALTITSPALANFSPKNVSTNSQNSTTTISYVEVSDTRAGSPGWSATMTSQRYTTRASVYRLAGSNNTVIFSGTYTGSFGILSPVGTYIVEITTGGSVGIAIFKWTSPLGTVTTNVTTASTVTLSAGISVNFGAATYQVGDKWQIAIDIFPYTGLYVVPSDITLISGSLTGVNKGVAEYLTGTSDTSNTKTIMSANVGYGTGVYHQDEGLDLVIHSNSLSGDYSAEIIFTAL